MRVIRASITAAGLLLGACDDPQAVDIEQAISGGQPVTSGPIARSTVMFVAQGGDGQHGCSASIVDATHAVSAAHCLIGLNAGDTPDLVFAPVVAPGAPRRTITAFVAPNASFDDDISVLTFTGGLPPGYAPVAFAAPTLALSAGDPLIHAGYGQTNATINDRGTLREVASAFVELLPLHRYQASSPNASICSGDSGGPDYVMNGASLVQIGVHVSGDCDSVAVSTDVRAYIGFIQGAGATPTLVNVLGADPATDAGVPSDAGVSSDAASSGDPPEDNGAADTGDRGGGCNTTGMPPGTALIAGLGFVVWRRRRARLA